MPDKKLIACEVPTGYDIFSECSSKYITCICDEKKEFHFFSASNITKRIKTEPWKHSPNQTSPLLPKNIHELKIWLLKNASTYLHTLYISVFLTWSSTNLPHNSFWIRYINHSIQASRMTWTDYLSSFKQKYQEFNKGHPNNARSKYQILPCCNDGISQLLFIYKISQRTSRRISR